MICRRGLVLVGSTLALCVANVASKPNQSVVAAKIGAGSPLLVDFDSDPVFGFATRVDIGKLRQVGDAIETEITWVLTLGMLLDIRRLYSIDSIPDKSELISRAQIVCGVDNALDYEIETRVVTPDGKLLYRRTYDPKLKREEAEEQRRKLGSGLGYSKSPYSLVCWAVARKCEGKDFTWPPPPNLRPLEYSTRATSMQNAYNARFVPNCRLSN